jgi:hypothetical protein
MTTDRRKVSVTIVFAIAFLLPLAAQVAGGQEANATLTSRAIAFVRMLAQGNLDAAEADFTDQMKQAAPPSKLREIWTGVQSQAGPFQGTGNTRTVVQGGFTTVVVGTNFKLQALGIAVAFDSSQKIAGMHFVPPP